MIFPMPSLSETNGLKSLKPSFYVIKASELRCSSEPVLLVLLNNKAVLT